MKTYISIIKHFSTAILFFAGIFMILVQYSCDQDNQLGEKDYTQYVNPFIGTSGRGHTFPGATYPFGFVQLNPRTGNRSWDYVAGYQYGDSVLMGFSHNMLSGGGGARLGDVLVLPYSDENILKNGGVLFSKEDEKASPGYYSTRLLEDNILVELTATERTGIHKYSFANEGKYHISVDVDEVIQGWWYEKNKSRVEDAVIQIENDSTITGFIKINSPYRESYFYVRFNRPFSTASFIEKKQNRKVILDFDVNKNEIIELRAGFSTVNTESARKNFVKELINKSFDEIKGDAKKSWNSYLSKVDITGTKNQKKIFYTALYHLLIQPNNITDVEEKYRGADRKVHTSSTGKMYSTFAFWDTYRAANPLYTILYPNKAGEFINSLISYYEERGNLPVWGFWGGDCYSMIGNHSVPVIVDAYLKEIKGFDAEKAYEAIKETLIKDHWNGNIESSGRKWKSLSWSNFDKFGFHPADSIFGESVSRTLEDSYDAWCASIMAKELGKEQDYEFFKRRAGFYKNVFDTVTGFMRGRNSDSSWTEPFNPLMHSHVQSSGGDYTEGNAWQWLWSVQHDAEGLINLFGTKELFVNKLDSLFLLPEEIIALGSANDISGLIGQYAHGNEPSQHVVYLYNYVDQPHKTQEMISKIMVDFFKNEPDGLCGNDDFGQMSAWYIFNTFGFYPVNPATGVFDIGIPAVEYAKIDLYGKEFTIKTKNFSDENKYISSITLNGNPVENFQITYKEIMSGGELVFEMGKKAIFSTN